MASALKKRGITRGDTVSTLLANTPEHLECHWGVPMAGAVINTINTRLDAALVAFCMEHSEASLLITDSEFAPTVKQALKLMKRPILVVDVCDTEAEHAAHGHERLGSIEYEAFLSQVVLPPSA